MTETAAPYTLDPASVLAEQVKRTVRTRIRPTTAEHESKIAYLEKALTGLMTQRDRLRKHVPFAYLVGLSLGTLVGMSLR